MSLDKIFGLYTVSFLAVTILIGIGELAFGLPNRWIGWIFMALSLVIYIVIGVVTRTSNPDQYYVAGRGVPAFYNGMATGSDWMSAASFISMGGALSAQGFAGLAYVMGWTGGYLLLAVFLGPYLRQFGAYTIPDFLSARYGGHFRPSHRRRRGRRLLLHVSDRAGHRRRPDRLALHRPRLQRGRLRRPAGRAVLLGAGRHALGHVDPGGAVHHPDHLLPGPGRVSVLAALLDPDPRADLRSRPAAEQQQGHRDHARRKEKETRALWKKDADELNAKIKAGGLPEAEIDKLKAQAALAGRQATAPAASDDAKISRYLTVPSGVGMWNFLALTFCLMVGTAGLPHILTRYYTTPSVRQARTSVAWSLFFIFLLYFTAPAYAAFARFTIYAKLVGTKVAELPRWVTLWQPAGLFDVVDKNGDGIVQWADFVIKSTDFVVLAMPEIAGLPFVITGLVMAGGLAAALSTADGLLLTIANAISHDLYYNVIDPSASLTKRLTITKVLLVVTAIIAAWVATFRLSLIVELVAWAFSLAGASFFPALVMGIWWKRANKAGAVAGMVLGLGITTYYMIGSRFYGLSWFGTQTIASAIFGLPAGFLTIWIVSLLTAPPPKAVQDLVVSVRYPKSGQGTALSAQGIGLGRH